MLYIEARLTVQHEVDPVTHVPQQLLIASKIKSQFLAMAFRAEAGFSSLSRSRILPLPSLPSCVSSLLTKAVTLTPLPAVIVLAICPANKPRPGPSITSQDIYQGKLIVLQDCASLYFPAMSVSTNEIMTHAVCTGLSRDSHISI